MLRSPWKLLVLFVLRTAQPMHASPRYIIQSLTNFSNKPSHWSLPRNIVLCDPKKGAQGLPCDPPPHNPLQKKRDRSQVKQCSGHHLATINSQQSVQA